MAPSGEQMAAKMLLVIGLCALCLVSALVLPIQAAQGPTPTATQYPQEIAYADDSTSEIWLMDISTSKATRIAPVPGGPGHLNWSPDGKTLAFDAYYSKLPSSSRNYVQISTINANGSGLTSLTQNEFPSYGPRWSPDGKQVSYSSYAPDFTSATIYTMNSDGSDKKTLQTFGLPKNQHFPNLTDWSPDGHRIAVIKANEDFYWNQDEKRFYFFDIFVLEIGGSLKNGIIKPLINVTKDVRDCDLGLEIHDVAWSPIGDQLAFSANCGGEAPRDIYTINIKPVLDGTGNATYINLTQGRMVAGSYGLDWSPDGTKIVFAGYADQTYESREIWLLDVTQTINTGKPVIRQLTLSKAGFHASYSWPAWRPNPGARSQPTPTRTLAPTARPK